MSRLTARRSACRRSRLALVVLAAFIAAWNLLQARRRRAISGRGGGGLCLLHAARIAVAMSPKRVFIYASVLALLTHIIILALYIHVPRFRESPGEDFVQFYGAAILSGEQPDKIYDTQSQMDIQKQFSAGARNGIHWPYLHAPFFTVLLMPLSWFSYVGAFWLWTLFTTTLYFVSVVLLIRSAPLRRPPLAASLAVAGALRSCTG